MKEWFQNLLGIVAAWAMILAMIASFFIFPFWWALFGNVVFIIWFIANT